MRSKQGLIDYWTVPKRTSLSEFGHLGLNIVRPCEFSFAAKILSPLNDVLVPLAVRSALDQLLSRKGISGVITTAALADCVPETIGLAIVEDPMVVHHRIHAEIAAMPGRLWNDFATEIHESAKIHPTAAIAPNNVSIGPDVEVMAGAIVNERCEIGASSKVHSGTILAGDAYEIIIIDDVQVLRPQTGGVAIGVHCEIMAGAVITRAAFGGATSIGDFSVLDANVVVSHDCRVGANVRIGGGAWVGGRVHIGNRASLGPNCSIANGLTIGENAIVSLGSVVTRNVPAGAHVSGNFAIEHSRMINHLRQIR